MQTTNLPFSFTIAREGASDNEAPLFSTRGQRLIFKVRVMLTQSQITGSGGPSAPRAVAICHLGFEHLSTVKCACISTRCPDFGCQPSSIGSTAQSSRNAGKP